MKSQSGRMCVAVAILSLPFAATGAQTQAAPDAIGTWRGTSLCLVQPSACKNETVVYRVKRIGTADSVSFDARKIVNGAEEEMGVLGCLVSRPTNTVTCTMPNGTWRFTVRGDSLVGELRLPDGTKFRDVRTSRDKGRSGVSPR